MANITKVMESFLTTPVHELKALFNEQNNNEWLAQFFDAVAGNAACVESSHRWSDRVAEILPEWACAHITRLFFLKLGKWNGPIGAPCPIAKALNELKQRIMYKDNITSALMRLPFNHHSHEENEFDIIIETGDIKYIEILLNFYIKKVGLEKLQKYLEVNCAITRLKFSDGIKILVSLCREKGIDPTFILPKESYASFLISRFRNLQGYIEILEEAGIPRTELLNKELLELCKDRPQRVTEVLKLIKQLEEDPKILAKTFMQKTPDELGALLDDKSHDWMVQFFNAIPNDCKEHELLLHAIPSNTCTQITHQLFERLGIHIPKTLSSEPECHIEEDLIMLEAAIKNKCSRHIDKLLKKIPLYHRIRSSNRDVFDIVFESNDIDLITLFFDIHLEKLGPDKFNEYLCGKTHTNLNPERIKQLIEYCHQKRLQPSFLLNIHLLANHPKYLKKLPLDQLIAFVEKNGAEILLEFHYKKVSIEEVLKTYQDVGVAPSVFFLSRDKNGISILERLEILNTMIAQLLSLMDDDVKRSLLTFSTEHFHNRQSAKLIEDARRELNG